jgi:hypothetical protein
MHFPDASTSVVEHVQKQLTHRRNPNPPKNPGTALRFSFKGFERGAGFEAMLPVQKRIGGTGGKGGDFAPQSLL